MSSLAEIVAGVLVEVLVFGIIIGALYRALAGRFLVPKREVVLPNQRGVLVEGSSIVRVAQPGICWVRPRQKVILLDARARPLHFNGLQLICSDGGIVRISVSGDFALEDPAVYYQGSTNANEAFLTEVRMALSEAARGLSTQTLVNMPQALASLVLQRMVPVQQTLGLGLGSLDIREADFVGQIDSAKQEIVTHSTLQ